MKENNYKKMALMLFISFIIMYGVMFLNADRFEHVMLSNTRTYMTLLMIAPMAIMKLLFMKSMYTNKRLNMSIMIGAIVVFFGALTMLRQQTFISDEQYMKAMIPHHSSAIMVSQKAHLKDPETKKLAEEIIKAQEKEIAKMNALIDKIKNN